MYTYDTVTIRATWFTNMIYHLIYQIFQQGLTRGIIAQFHYLMWNIIRGSDWVLDARQCALDIEMYLLLALIMDNYFERNKQPYPDGEDTKSVLDLLQFLHLS